MSVRTVSTQTAPQSKTLLVLMEAFGLGAFGLDRIYMGAYRTGLLKLFLFALALTTSILLGPVGIWFAMAWALWTFVDYCIVMVNAVLRASWVPFRSEGTRWVGMRDTDLSFAVAFVLVVLNLVGAIAGGPKVGRPIGDLYRKKCSKDEDCTGDQFCNGLGRCIAGTRRPTPAP